MLVAAQAPSTTKGIYCIGFESHSYDCSSEAYSFCKRFFCHACFEEKTILRKMNIPYPNCRPPAMRRQKLLQIFCFYFWMIARSLSTSLTPSDISYKGIRRNYTHGRKDGEKMNMKMCRARGEKNWCRRCRSNFITRQPLHARSAGEMPGESVYSEKKGWEEGGKEGRSVVSCFFFSIGV